MPDAQQALAGLKDGSCHVLDSSFSWDDAQLEGIAIQLQPTGVWEQLVIGIQPASYDEYYNPIYGDRPDFFGDRRTRQAIAACIDREALLSAGGAGAALWPSFVRPEQSQLRPEDGLVFNPSEGQALLAEVGWRDHDLNPDTALQAWNVPNVPPGTFFEISLMVDESRAHWQIAEGVAATLRTCGIGVDIISLPAEQVFAPGPEGPIFGRQFDLAIFAWQPSPALGCRLYQSGQIPNAGNNWIGTNPSGWGDPQLDAACADAVLALPADFPQALVAAEQAFLNALPSLPLLGYAERWAIAQAGCLPLNAAGDGDFFEWIEHVPASQNCLN